MKITENRWRLQRLCGLALIALPLLLLGICGGDATCVIITLPLGIWMTFGNTYLFAGSKAQMHERRSTMQEYIIKYVRGHYEAYAGGRFLCSGDTREECLEAIDEISAAA